MTPELYRADPAPPRTLGLARINPRVPEGAHRAAWIERRRRTRKDPDETLRREMRELADGLLAGRMSRAAHKAMDKLEATTRGCTYAGMTYE